jgi:hypothetical protein
VLRDIKRQTIKDLIPDAILCSGTHDAGSIVITFALSYYRQLSISDPHMRSLLTFPPHLAPIDI